MRFRTDKSDEVRHENDNEIRKRVILKILGYGLLIVVALSFVIGVYRIDDNDMYPAFKDGDLVVVYRLGEFYTSDAVVYKAEGETRYGRVVAVAGDEIAMTDEGYYTINGSVPYENIFYPTKPEPGVEYPYKVKENEAFIMGDMRRQAKDSRSFGGVPIKNIKGKIVLLLFRGRGF